MKPNLNNLFASLQNRVFLRWFCQYLHQDTCGNRIYQGQYFDSNINKIIIVTPDNQSYLIRYFQWFDDYNPFYEEFCSENESLFDFC